MTAVPLAVIALIEEISLNALPALQTFFYDGWIARMSNSYSRRANSVQTFGESIRALDEKIAHCEKLYRQNNLPVIFKMTAASQPPHLDQELQARGYQSEGRTSVQTCALDAISMIETSHIHIHETWNDEWYAEFCRMNNPAPAQRETLKKMLQLILPRTGFALLHEEHGARACGLGVLQENYLGLFDIVVDANARRRGYGKQLVTQVLAWGKANGAQLAYLQVVSNNEPALNLYAQLGFVEKYQYWYRVRV